MASSTGTGTDRTLATNGDRAATRGLRDLLRVDEDRLDLAGWDPGDTPGFPDPGRKDKSGKKKSKKKDAPHGRKAGERELAAMADELEALQERLFAESRAGGPRRVLLVLQGMDTSGKGGVVKHVVGLLDPLGVRLTSFKAPTAEEKRRPFLWRIRRALPGPGEIGVFDRSHYEDVLVVRVHDLVPARTWRRRYATINAFEQDLVDDGTVIVKCFLHVSADAQQERLAERLEHRSKWWKYNPADVDEREHWAAYAEAYGEVLRRCSTDAAPWYVVPSDHKWYRNWAVGRLLLESLRELDPQWPDTELDLDAERKRVAAATI